MIAAHYIALLLLSTADVGSREHREIVDANGPGIWQALLELDLVDQLPIGYRLSDRGQVLVAHILALPLPQRVSAYSMGGAQVTAGAAHIVHSAQSAVRTGQHLVQQPTPAAATSPVDDENYVHTVAPVSMLPKISVPTDPAQRRTEARAWLDRGYSVNEVATMFDLDTAEVESIFFRGVG